MVPITFCVSFKVAQVVSAAAIFKIFRPQSREMVHRPVYASDHVTIDSIGKRHSQNMHLAISSSFEHLARAVAHSMTTHRTHVADFVLQHLIELIPLHLAFQFGFLAHELLDFQTE